MRAVFNYLTGSRKGACDLFEGDRVTIGRAPDNMLAFPEAERRVSAHHAEIRRNGSLYILRDLGSTNGTMINGRRVTISELHHDDLVEFGAGGPQVRFGIENDTVVAPTEEVMLPDSLMASIKTAPLIESAASSGSARRARTNNTWLILSVVAAMVIGAIAGVVLSARMVDRRAGFANVAERNSPAVVFIRVEFALIDANGRTSVTDARSGSGFVVSSSGLIITNRHLIHDWEYNEPPPGVSGKTTRIEVIFPGRRVEEAIPATLHKLSADKEIDVAILRINPPPGMTKVEGLEPDLEGINQGEDVAVIGYPLGLDLLEDRIETSLSTGVVSRVNQNLIQINLRAYRGNSGGPALNRRGRVIGILTSNVASAQDITFCTPIGLAYDLIKDEIQYGRD
jgi:S1-C subfamily serine protease